MSIFLCAKLCARVYNSQLIAFFQIIEIQCHCDISHCKFLRSIMLQEVEIGLTKLRQNKSGVGVKIKKEPTSGQ